MCTQDRSNESSYEDEEHESLSLMDSTLSSVQLDETKNDNDEQKLFYKLSRDELVVTLNELLGKIQRMTIKYKCIKNIYDRSLGHHENIEKENDV